MSSIVTLPSTPDTNQPSLLRRMCDAPTEPWRWGPPPLGTALWRTLRYASAGRGLALTANERRLLALHNAHRGQRCFIMGNGPSLNQCDLTPLAGEYTFGVNSIFLNRDAMGFDPTYYVVEDILVAEDRAQQIDAYEGPEVKFFGNYLQRYLRGDDRTAWLNVMVDYRDYPGFPHFAPNAFADVVAQHRDRIDSGDLVMLIADTLPVQLDFVRSGDTNALVGQRPWEMGYRSMYILRQMMDGVMPSDPTYTGLDKCDASNIDTCVGG